MKPTSEMRGKMAEKCRKNTRADQESICYYCHEQKGFVEFNGCSCGCHPLTNEEKKRYVKPQLLHECCDGECHHDACCGKVEANCPNYSL